MNIENLNEFKYFMERAEQSKYCSNEEKDRKEQANFIAYLYVKAPDLIRYAEAALKMREELGKMDVVDLQGDVIEVDGNGNRFSYSTQRRVNEMWRTKRDAIVSNFDKEAGV